MNELRVVNHGIMKLEGHGRVELASTSVVPLSPRLMRMSDIDSEVV